MKAKVIFILHIAPLLILLTGCVPGTAVRGERTARPLAPTQIATVEQQTIQYPESGPVVRLNYDPALTGPVEPALVEAVANSPDQPASMAHPAYVQLAFPEFGKGQTYQLAYPISGPQIIVYRTQDFAGYGSENQRDYPHHLSQLREIIDEGLDPQHCAQPLAGYEQALPFLPLVHAAQIFCAQAEPISFQGGRGIRYITYYAQDASPAIEWFVFYTFQGLTDDGQYYISAVLPVQTNILPDEPPAPGSEPDLDAQAALLRQQVAQINAQAADGFTPLLSVLDGIMAGVQVPGD